MTSIDEATRMAEDCQKREEQLSTWEREFIQYIGEQLDEGRPLTPRQSDKLDQIWERVT